MTRRYRVFVLRDFLLNTYGLERLRQGPVFDVAGGKGDLAWLLRNADGIEAVVVDPRVTDHTKLVRACEWLIEHPAEAKLRADPATPGFMAIAALALTPPFHPARHLRLFLDEDLLHALAASTAGPVVADGCSAEGSAMEMRSVEGDVAAAKGRWEAFFEVAIARAEAIEGERAHHQPVNGWRPKGWRPELDGGSGRVRCAREAREILAHPRGIVAGFHPDEATEALVDFALARRLPFAVVPCCVFPSRFPDRRLPGIGSRPVSSHADFVAYLRAKHPAIRVAQLDFQSRGGEGEAGARNTVLYTLPGDYDLRCVEIFDYRRPVDTRKGPEDEVGQRLFDLEAAHEREEARLERAEAREKRLLTEIAEDGQGFEQNSERLRLRARFHNGEAR